MPRIVLAALVLLTVVSAGACGGSSESDPPAPSTPLTIEQALAGDGENPIAVRGYIVAPEGEPIELCSALLKSYPPQCGAPSLVVEGLDLSTIEGLTETTDPSLAQVQWTDTEVTVAGSLEEGVLLVGESS